MSIRKMTLALPAATLIATAASLMAQANLPIYTDNLVDGFQDWSWATRSLTNTAPVSFVHSGTTSIRVTTTAWTALSFQHSDFDFSPYASLSFYANGGTNGGQVLQVYLEYGPNGATNGPTYSVPGALAANTWQQITVPLSALGVGTVPVNNRISIVLTGNGTTTTFYIDDITLLAAPAPTLVHLSVDASQMLRGVDPRQFGLNTAVWDSYFDTVATSNALRELGCLSLRFPGGSLSDNYDWVTGKDGNNSRPTKWPNFMHVATNAGVQAFITVNYGTGTSNKAADWVKNANLTNHCGFKYWEVGNECYGSWETDSNNVAHDPYTYASRAANYIALMRAADPAIKVGVVAAPGEDSYANNTLHPATNPRTGVVHNGWTPVMLTRLKSLGVTPDFLVDHVYPQYTATGNPPPASDSDALVLQSTSGWASDASDLRQQLNDYMGSSATNVELVSTENNSDSGAFGRQLTSVVNGLYVADSMCQLMKTELNAYTWWDLRNGQSSSGSFDPTVYGWRTYGDEGIINANGNPGPDRYPVFYGIKMMQYYARPGDTILNATSDYLLLSAYGARKADGALNLLVINKDLTANFSAQINLAGFSPSPIADVRSYGILQDEATRTNGPTSAQDISATTAPVSGTFSSSFPPGSLTLFTFAPAAPQLQFVSTDGSSQFVFQLQGQTSTPYIVQASADGLNWTSISTNFSGAGSINVTNSLTPGQPQQFWRAVWMP